MGMMLDDAYRIALAPIGAYANISLDMAASLLRDMPGEIPLNIACAQLAELKADISRIGYSINRVINVHMLSPKIFRAIGE